MAVNKVEFGDQVVMDITDSTVSPEKLLSGETAYDRSGAKITGSLVTKDITVTPKRDTGENIATITIDDTDHDIYALSEEEVADFLSGDQEVEGNPVTLKTLIGGNAKSCSVDLLPIQDLHGYNSPWVGGAGKNKLPMTVSGIKALNTGGTWSGNTCVLNGITFEIQTDNDGNVIGINVKSGTASANADLYIVNVATGLLANTQYIMSGCPSGGSSTTYRFFANFYYGSSNHVFNDTGNGVTAQWKNMPDDCAGGIQVRIASGYTIPTGGLLFKPMIRLSIVADGTFAPYENKCPITGRNSVTVKRTGKNLYPSSRISGTLQGVTATQNGDTYSLSGTSSAYTQFISSETFVLSAGTYTIKHFNWTSSNICLQLRSVDGLTIYANTAQNGGVVTFTLTELTELKARIVVQANTATNTSFKIEIVVGSEAPAAYEPYQEEAATINLPSTIYEGTVNVTDGDTESTHETVDLGDLSWTYSGNGVFYSNDISSVVKRPASNNDKVNGYCECYSIETRTSIAGQAVDSAIGCSNVGLLLVRDTRYTDATAFTTAVTEKKFCYELATPTTLSTSAEQISLLKGINVLTTDGDNIDITWQNIPNIEKLIGNTIEGILTAGSTSLTLQSDKITEDSTLDIYTDKYGVNPTDITVTNGQAVLTFESQSTDLKVKVKVM